MREGPDEELKLTENAQPAIMGAFDRGIRATVVFACRPGQFCRRAQPWRISALCAAGSLTSTTAKLLKLRGQAMQRAVPVGEGAMAALLGADLVLAQQIADAAAQAKCAPSPMTTTPARS